MGLAKLRHNAGFKTQTDLAKAIGVKQSTVAMWENEKRRPRYKYVEKLANVLNVENSIIINCFLINK